MRCLVSASESHMTQDVRIQVPRNEPRLAVSLKTLACLLDAHRSSVRRWLREAGIDPIAIGRGPKGAIRYRWCDVEAWLDSLETIR